MRLSSFWGLVLLLVSSITVAGCGTDPKTFQPDLGSGGSGFQGNCGNTMAPCPQGMVCDGVMCVQSCVEDSECGVGSCCSAGCYDLATSQAHCGGCGMRCGDSQQCTAGACTDLVCSPPGRTGGDPGGGGFDDGSGADDDAGVPMADPIPGQTPGPNGCFTGEECRKDMATGAAGCYCGSAGPCAIGTVCNGGSCLCGSAACMMGQVCCGGTTCASTDSDPNNCGGCGNVCAGGLQCISGDCACPMGQELCNGACADINSDTANCGECGKTCDPSSTCSGGSCDCATDGEIDCDGVCRPEDDPMHCGACGNECTGGNPPVRCFAKDDMDGNPLPIACHCFNDDYSRCGGDSCVKLGEGDIVGDSVEHCGACGNTCDGGANVCTDGVCGCPDAADTECNETCVDLRWDAENCGSCGLSCADGEQCLDGACTCDAAEASDPAHPYGYCSDGGGGYSCETIDDEVNCGFDCEVCWGQSFCDTGGNVQSYACTCDDNALDYCGDPNAPCVDMQTDPNNCGSCGFACLDGDSCVDGVCDCGSNQTYCDTGDGVYDCATTINDVDNCGGCGIKCDTGAEEVCCNSVCAGPTDSERGEDTSCGTCNMNCPDGVAPLFGSAPPGVCNWSCNGSTHTGFSCGTGDAVRTCN